MKNLMDRVLKRIENMSDEQFTQRIETAKSGEVATFMKKMREFSAWAESVENTFLEETVSVFYKDYFDISINYSDEEFYSILYAANDERFALAA